MHEQPRVSRRIPIDLEEVIPSAERAESWSMNANTDSAFMIESMPCVLNA